jgi:hypothetical protein
MTSTVDEHPIAQRVSERPSFKPQQVRAVRFRELGYRFIAGAATSIAAGVITLAFGSRVGGVFLAFPAILAASLTLIAKEDDPAEAREDVRGAVIGGLALALFAAVAALTLGNLSAPLALLLAIVGWFVGANVGYLIAWFR